MMMTLGVSVSPEANPEKAPSGQMQPLLEEADTQEVPGDYRKGTWVAAAVLDQPTRPP